MDKYILKGIFKTFNTNTSGGRIYPESMFLRQLRCYKRKTKIIKILNDQAREI